MYLKGELSSAGLALILCKFARVYGKWKREKSDVGVSFCFLAAVLLLSFLPVRMQFSQAEAQL